MVRVLECVVGMNRGGIETLLMELYRRMDRTKVQMDFLVSLDGIYDEEIRALGGKIYTIPFISKVGPFAYGASLRRFFAAHPEYRIVHAHMDKFGAEVMREAKKAGVPVRILHSHSTLNEGGLAYQLVKNYYGRFYQDATDYFACSREAAEFLFGPQAARAVILKNGVDTERFCPDEHTSSADRFRIGHVGRFLPAKNHAFLLRVFAAVHEKAPEATLELVGDGPLRAEAAQKAKDLGLSDAVTFTGAVQDVAAIEKQWDVFVMPSQFEGLGIALVEAQSCGLPCVASDTIPQEANVSGAVQYLPLSASPEIWAQAVLALRGQPKRDMRAAIRAAGYDIHTSAEFLQNFYLEKAKEARA
jgi:glycosyltransferase involved in cell wall biosynthesis